MKRLLVDAHKGLGSCELYFPRLWGVCRMLELTFRPLSLTKLGVWSPLKPGLCSRTAEYVAIVPANGRYQHRPKKK